MKFKLENRVRFGFGACFILLSLAFLISIATTNNLLKQIRLVNYNSAIIQQLVKAAAASKDLREAFSTYMLTGKPSAVRQYNQVRNSVDSNISAMQKSLSYNSNYVYHLQLVQQQLSRHYLLARRGIIMYNASHGRDTSLQGITAELGQVTDAVIGDVNYIKHIEDGELNKKIDKLMYYNELVKKINITSLVLVITLVSYSLYIYNKENRAKQRADRKTQNYQEQLKKRILELKNANEELRTLRGNEKFSATGRVAQTIAHEIRNPLTNINLASAHLANDPALSAHASMLEIIDTSTKRINQMITDLLNSTRFQELDFNRVLINEVLDETLDAAKGSIQLKSVQVVRDYGEGICAVWADREKLKIAIFNIVINAIDAMEPEKGVLTLKTETLQQRCAVSISDNGSGIEEDLLNKLFDPYFTNKARGTGLGLTNARNIILNHKGEISVVSKPGSGSTFRILLDFARKLS